MTVPRRLRPAPGLAETVGWGREHLDVLKDLRTGFRFEP